MGGIKDLLGDAPASYPHQPGYKERTTSRDAALTIGGSAHTGRTEALRILSEHPNGLTSDEIAEHMNRTVLYTRPRLSELQKLKQIEPTGERRRNTSGLTAKVWRVKEPTNGLR